MIAMQQWIKERGLSSTPLHGEPFAVGDVVTFTNDYGVKFEGLRVIGFDNPIYENSGTIYIDTDAFWFPHRPDQLKKEH